MEEQREALSRWDLINATSQRHGEAWDRLRQMHVDYSLDVPTYTEIFEHAKVQEESFFHARDKQGERWSEVALWLIFDVAPRLRLPSGVFNPDAIEQIVMVPSGGILSIEGGYFIRLPDAVAAP
ncbi:MAG: hypothetical protein V4624_09905 [Pseudomonadota bacterium]